MYYQKEALRDCIELLEFLSVLWTEETFKDSEIPETPTDPNGQHSRYKKGLQEILGTSIDPLYIRKV